jgi:peptidyl-prolyl cis-trans isomerase A (cyclophilin A)
MLLAVALVIAYLAWPRSDAPDAGRVGDASVEQAERDSTSAANPVVEIQTTMGTIRAELFRDKAPETVDNFVDLVQQRFYDGLIFHRVIDQFMLQTGDPRGDGTGGREDKGLPAKFLRDEFHPDLRHDSPGLLSMANSGPHTGDTQFFITTVPTPWLDNKHAIFGKVIEGLDIVRKIEKVPTDGDDRPVEEVRMTRVKIEGGE